MKKISINLDRFKKISPQAKVLNERAALLKEFLDTLNADREGYPPLKPARLGVMLAPIKTKDLYGFLADCKYASHFGKYFWSRFKRT